MTPRILIVRFSSMGDILLTTPLLRAIRSRHPQASITYVTRVQFTPLLENNPRITELIGYDTSKPLRPLGRHLAAMEFTHRLDLHGSLRSWALRRMVPGRWGTYPKHRAARAWLIRTKRNRYRDTRPVAERYFDAAKGLDVTPDGKPAEFFIRKAALDTAATMLANAGLGQDRGLVAVCPGAAHATKQWPVGHWRTAVAQLTASGFDVIVLGGPEDRELGEAVASGGGERAASAAGLVEIGVSAALLTLSQRAIAGDTGLMHLATAVGTPVVALYGPTVEPFGFFPYRGSATVIERPLACRPCTAMGGDRCPLGHHRCMVDIEPTEVIEAVRKLRR